MATPVLTKNQERHSLSAKKKGPAKFKNVLAQPYPNFWPVISVAKYPELVTTLNMILPSIKRFNTRISKDVQKDLKTMTKKERFLAKKKIYEQAPPKPDVLKFMIIGINEVTRALEKNNVCCVLIDANVEPPLLIKHIITMAVNKKIPILLLPILKAVTLEKLKFPATVLGLKQEIMKCPDSVCHSLYKSIAEAFKDFEVPECMLQHCKLEIPDKMPDESTECEMKIVGMDSDTKSNIPRSEKPVVIFTDVYKYRSSGDERAFIPPTFNQNSQISQTLNEFIALGSDLDFTNDKNYASISKTERYTNIVKEEIHERTKIENTETYRSCDKQLINDNTNSTKQTNTLKRKKDDGPNYLSLKIKRIIPNKTRYKATKFKKK
ncbi:uncharacterized protein LOC105837220 isoform X2 [Monomorium pharaonis]|nr:uncharacterized protein LOC105837220 isoform X2 [Monomorium pharaonis]